MTPSELANDPRVDRVRLRALVEWMAQTVHQAYHDDQGGTFRDCPKIVCEAARRELNR